MNHLSLGCTGEHAGIDEQQKCRDAEASATNRADCCEAATETKRGMHDFVKMEISRSQTVS